MNAFVSSTAVMQRRVEPPDSLEFFPTPPWATRAWAHHVLPWLDDREGLTAWDPCCGEGHMALALADYFAEVEASDIFSYGFGAVGDFLHHAVDYQTDWIVFNPPFSLAIEFVLTALEKARRGVAVLARVAFAEGEERYRKLFAVRPPTRIAYYVERVPMHAGRWVIDGSSATAYAWFCWKKDAVPAAPIWIPKSRKLLSRHDDWLRFGGCEDVPKRHPVLAEIERRYAEGLPVWQRDRTAGAVGRPAPATIADVRRNLELLL
jgi:hypothetical protein